MRSNRLATLIPVLALTLTSCAGSVDKVIDPEEPPPATGSTSHPPPEVSDQEKRLTAAFYKCAEEDPVYGEPPKPGECIAMTPLPFKHPKYGPAQFSVGEETSAEGAMYLRYWLLDSEGHVLKTKKSKELAASNTIENLRNDGSGNITYTYSSGRPGCVALRPDGEWFEGFGTDPMEVGEDEMPYMTRFYEGAWTDADHDGTYEIRFPRYPDPNDGQQPTVYEWDGSDYVANEDAPVPDL